MSASGQDAEPPATLVAGMLASAAAYPDNGFTFQDAAGRETFYSFPDLLAATERAAAGLQALGLRHGDRIALLTQDPEEFIIAFLGAVRAGIAPAPLYPPPPLGGIEIYLSQTVALLEVARPAALIGSAKVLGDIQEAVAGLDGIKTVATVQEIRACQAPMTPCEVGPDDVVFLQFTSGSTSTPRGVIVTHRALVANIACFMDQSLQADPTRDKGVTWLPLYHDMGLIGFVLGPVHTGVSVVFMPTVRFAKSPAAWLDALHQHRGTITFAPNFAFALLLRRLRVEDLGRWDLSCVKALGCGAEPIHPDLIERFLDVFAAAGLSRDAFLPAYGLAEATLAVALRRLGAPISTRRVDRETFERTGVSTPAREERSWLDHVGFGGAFAGHEIAIRDPDGAALPHGREGDIWLHGPSVCAGYLGDEAGWNAICRDGWLNTGDRGYLADGELFVSGRSKELIIVNGRNIHPQPLEWAVSALSGVRPQCVAAFAVPSLTTEAIVIALEAKGRPTTDLVAAVEDAVEDLVACRPLDVVLLPSGSLSRTTSGKLKRGHVRRRYLDGDLPRLEPTPVLEAGRP
jgi:fatty-acyl-CoA synthase